MKNALRTTLLAGLLITAGLAVAGVTKATFDVTFPDGTQGTIHAGSKIVHKAVFTECGYEDVNGKSLGSFGSPDFGTTDPVALEEFCLAHFADRS